MAAGIWENPGVAVETNVYRCEPEGWAARGEVGEKGPSPWWGREGEVPVAPKIVGVIRGDTGGGVSSSLPRPGPISFFAR